MINQGDWVGYASMYVVWTTAVNMYWDMLCCRGMVSFDGHLMFQPYPLLSTDNSVTSVSLQQAALTDSVSRLINSVPPIVHCI